MSIVRTIFLPMSIEKDKQNCGGNYESEKFCRCYEAFEGAGKKL